MLKTNFGKQLSHVLGWLISSETAQRHFTTQLTLETNCSSAHYHKDPSSSPQTLRREITDFQNSMVCVCMFTKGKGTSSCKCCPKGYPKNLNIKAATKHCSASFTHYFHLQDCQTILMLIIAGVAQNMIQKLSSTPSTNIDRWVQSWEMHFNLER